LIKIIIINRDFNVRLDKYLKNKFTALTQSFIEKNIRKKNIIINNLKTSAKYIVEKNDELKILNFHKEKYKNKIIFKKNIVVPNELLKLFNKSIIYENKNFLILDKWPSISTQGGSKINISIDDIIKKISNQYRLVHRLDMETSGLLIISKNLETAKKFGKLFQLKNIEKTYLAICEGKPKITESIVELDMKNKFEKIDKTETYYKVLYFNGGVSFILFKPKTGKIHQIRKVSKNLGSPIIGDNKYNSHSIFKKENLMLNAYELKFIIDNKDFKFCTEIPEHFNLFIKKNKLKSIKKFL